MSDTLSAIAEFESARGAAAIGGEFACDHIEVKGVRFYYKTVAHAWIIPAVFNRLAGLSDFEKGVVTCYLLSCIFKIVVNGVLGVDLFPNCIKCIVAGLKVINTNNLTNLILRRCGS